MKKTVVTMGHEKGPVYQSIVSTLNQVSGEYKNFPLTLHHLPNTVLGPRGLEEQAKRLSSEFKLIVIDISGPDFKNDQRVALMKELIMLPKSKAQVVISVFADNGSSINSIQCLTDFESHEFKDKINILSYSNEKEYKDGLLCHMEIKKHPVLIASNH